MAVHAQWMPNLIVITGPTASGKTDLSDWLAEVLDGEIINADTGQMYTTFSVGTAKPDWKLGRERYHLFDLVDGPTYPNAVDWWNKVREAIEQIQSRGRLPIIVGGSMFYIRQIFFPQINAIKTGDVIKAIQSFDGLTTPEAYKKVQELDPQRALQLHPNDRFRALQALRQIEAGAVPSLSKPKFAYPSKRTLLIGLDPDRQWLKDRIALRLAKMLEANEWQEEVARVNRANWEAFWHGRRLLGYRHLSDFQSENQIQEGDEAKKNLAKLQEKIYKDTAMYARKQLSAWRNLQRQLDLIRETGKELKVWNLDQNYRLEELLERIKAINW